MKKLIFYLLTITLFFLILLAPLAQKKGPTPVSAQDLGFRIEVGEEEYVMGPSSQYIDSYFFTVKTSSGIRGFSQGRTTYSFFGPNLENLAYEGVALSRGNPGRFDDEGAWFNSAYKLNENHWIGWYHAEQDVGGGAWHLTRQSMAFAESFNAGRTWTKPNYPYNQVLTVDVAFNNDPNKDDAGNARVLKVGDYFYMFFTATSDWTINLARSKVSDLGKPGTWYKYYNGSFSEPGIGGKSTGIQNLIGGFVIYNSYLNRHLSSLVSGRWGFHLAISNGDDLTSWQYFPGTTPETMIYPLVSHTLDSRADNWISPQKQIYAYPSFIAPDGNSDTVGKEFYLYYMKLFDGEGFDRRYLLRRKLTLYKTSDDPYYTKVALVRYEKQNPKKTKVSTELVKPSEGYQKKQILGYLLPYLKDGFQPLYDCYIPIWNDYMVSSANPSLKNWEHCESDGDTFVRTIGWISQTKTEDANLPLYRCFDQQNTDHFLSTDPNCEGKKTEHLIGYLFEKSFSELPPTTTPTPVPTATPTPVPTPTGTPTPTPTSSVPPGGIPGDVNQDGLVNSQDLKILLENWGNSPVVFGADLNSDRVVNGLDFGKLRKLIQ